MLAYYLKKMFAMEKRAERIGAKAKEHAIETHDREQNIKVLLKIYEDILR